MSARTVPDETNSLSLLTEPDIRTFVQVTCNGKLLPVFAKSRAGPDRVTGFIPAAEGVEFGVGWYYGKEKKPKTSLLVEIYFGETLVKWGSYLVSDFKPTNPLDHKQRFKIFTSIKVDKDTTRNFTFGKIPTTDDKELAVKDLDYLDSVSAIRVKTYHITNARYVRTGWKDPSPLAKTPVPKVPFKRTATEMTQAEHAPTGSPSTGGGQKGSQSGGQDDTQQELPPMPKRVRDVEAALRPIDEQCDKGKFGLAPCFGPVISKKADKPSGVPPSSNDGAPSSSAAHSDVVSSSVATITSTADHTPSSTTHPTKEPKKKAKKVPIEELKYDEKKLASTSVFLLRSLPWIAQHLDSYWFDPTPPDPAPEPTVEFGDVIYVDATAEEAEEDARTTAAIERPAKRQKVVDLMEQNSEDGGEGSDSFIGLTSEDSEDEAAQAAPLIDGSTSQNDCDSLLADIAPTGPTAHERQEAEVRLRRDATQAVSSLANTQPSLKQIKQETFAHRPLSGHSRSNPDEGPIMTKPTSAATLSESLTMTATASFVPQFDAIHGMSVSSTATTYGPAPFVPDTDSVSTGFAVPTASRLTQPTQPCMPTLQVRKFQSRTSQGSNRPSATTTATTSSYKPAASGSGVGKAGARVIGTGTQIGMKR
ncbi:hypothetical protein JCM10908_005974 [Rhodotorula pacifica]|uniref:uncharacterized protein n=1 Tax=Rhodotorula pacifica TaxID=1495444 RepID=UPI00317A66A2